MKLYIACMSTKDNPALILTGYLDRSCMKNDQLIKCLKTSLSM